MAGRTGSVRAQAIRRARDAKASRDLERERRDKQIEAALADFFEGSAQAEQIRADAQAKAARLIEQAEQAASVPEQAAAGAVRALRRLDQTNADIAGLCGISVGAIRAMVAETDIPTNRPVAAAA